MSLKLIKEGSSYKLVEHRGNGDMRALFAKPAFTQRNVGGPDGFTEITVAITEEDAESLIESIKELED